MKAKLILICTLMLLGMGCSENSITSSYDQHRIISELNQHQGFELSEWKSQGNQEMYAADKGGEISISPIRAVYVHKISDITSAARSLRQCAQLGEIAFNHSVDARERIEKAVMSFMDTQSTQSFFHSGLEFVVAYLPQNDGVLACRVQKA